MKKIATPLLALSALCCHVAFATTMTTTTPIPILNQNFESDLLNATTGTTKSISGWLSDGQGTSGTVSPTEGKDYAKLGDRGQVAYLTGGARISQLLPVDLRSNEEYTLTFDAGHPNLSAATSVVARLTAQGLTLGQYQVDIPAIPKGTWKSASLTIKANESMPLNKALAVEFYNLSDSASEIAHIDNVALSASGVGSPLRFEKTGSGMITRSIHLRVPEQFATIQDALNFLKPHAIQADKLVTILVSDCSGQTGAIRLNHPQGANIQLISSTGHVSQCQLRISANPAIQIDEGKEFGLIDGFTLQSANAGYVGVLASTNSTITFGDNMLFTGFSSALKAEKLGLIVADGVTFTENKYDAEALLSGIVTARNSESRLNTDRNFYAQQAGRIFAEGATVNTSGKYNYFSRGQSYINANNTVSISASENFYVRGGSAISAINSDTPSIKANHSLVWELSHIDRTGSPTDQLSPKLNNGSTQKK